MDFSSLHLLKSHIHPLCKDGVTLRTPHLAAGTAHFFQIPIAAGTNDLRAFFSGDIRRGRGFFLSFFTHIENDLCQIESKGSQAACKLLFTGTLRTEIGADALTVFDFFYMNCGFSFFANNML